MKRGIRMIAVDLDGTLLNSEKRISPEDAEALRLAAAQGVEVVPVTGRNFYFALPHLEGWPGGENPLIASNGAVIRFLRGETVQRSLLPREAAGVVLERTREFRPYTAVVYDGPGKSEFWFEAQSDASGEPVIPVGGVAASSWLRRNPSLVRFTSSLEKDLRDSLLQILFAGPVEMTRAVIASLNTARAETGSSERGFRLLRTEYPQRDFSILDVIRWDCSKGHALEYWSHRRGVPPAEIMAIGDNYNDLEMLEWAGLPVVMGNAEETLKQRGWAVTCDCDSSGVAHAIQQYVL